MFEDLLGKIVGAPLNSSQRADGAAFLKVARDLYGLSGLDYLGLNIPVPSGTQRYAHCCYSDTSVKHCFSAEAVSVEPLTAAGLDEGPRNWEPGKPEWLAGEGLGDPETHAMTFPLPSRHGEQAIFGIMTVAEGSDWQAKKSQIMQEVRILGEYLHSHVLRINGNDANGQILVSARELDCLKWTAAGKTAWEASVILGISERTVRFHLNAAREKLDCTTTTQAVAKAITQHLIEL
jgi:DNA-binding CsgD family transcriptional regulator